MIIPGRKRPAGIHTPYVVIVIINQTPPNTNRLIVSNGGVSGLAVNSDLITPFSVLKNNVAIGLYSSSFGQIQLFRVFTSS
jgi:hypothetical protein